VEWSGCDVFCSVTGSSGGGFCVSGSSGAKFCVIASSGTGLCVIGSSGIECCATYSLGVKVCVNGPKIGPKFRSGPAVSGGSHVFVY
jgi:hypothetical protein